MCLCWDSRTLLSAEQLHNLRYIHLAGDDCWAAETLPKGILVATTCQKQLTWLCCSTKHYLSRLA